jgi:hypothetical protein
MKTPRVAGSPFASGLSLILFLSFALTPLRAGIPLQDVQVVTTDRVDFAAGGTIRVLAATGELNIEAWDQPQVEITVTRSAWTTDTPAAKEKMTRELNLTTVTHEKKAAAELVLATVHKRSNTIHLDYRIMVPRTSHLVIEHRIGDIVVNGVTGGIDAHAHEGDILLLLPSTGQYSFDAATKFGGIHSDYPGSWHSNAVTGEKTSQDAPAPAARIHLRVGIGGIEIQKLTQDAVTPTT